MPHIVRHTITKRKTYRLLHLLIRVRCSTRVSADSTMHVIYRFVGHLSAATPMRQTHNEKKKREIKTKKRNSNQHLKKRDENTRNFHFYLFASRFVCYYASCDGGAISLVVIEALTSNTYAILWFRPHQPQWLSSARRLCCDELRCEERLCAMSVVCGAMRAKAKKHK